MIIPLILAVTFLVTSTAIPKDPTYTYDLTSKELYDQNKRSASGDFKPTTLDRGVQGDH